MTDTRVYHPKHSFTQAKMDNGLIRITTNKELTDNIVIEPTAEFSYDSKVEYLWNFNEVSAKKGHNAVVPDNVSGATKIFHYKCNEGSGTTITDSVNGEVLTASTANGGVAGFDNTYHTEGTYQTECTASGNGKSALYGNASLTNEINMNELSEWTLHFTMNPTQTLDDPDDFAIFPVMIGDYASNLCACMAYIDGNVSGSMVIHIFNDAGNPDTAITMTSVTQSWVANATYEVIVTYDDTDGYELWINGKMEDSNVDTDPIYKTDVDFFIASWCSANDAGSYGIRVDDLWLINKDITQTGHAIYKSATEPAQEETIVKYGAASIDLDGTDDYVYVRGGLDTVPSDGSIFIHFYPDATFNSDNAADMYLLHKINDADNGIKIWLESDSGALMVTKEIAAVENTLTSITKSWTGAEWHWIRYIWGASGHWLIVDGKVEAYDKGVITSWGNRTVAEGTANVSMYIGCESTPSLYFNGKIDDVRISDGRTHEYTGNGMITFEYYVASDWEDAFKYEMFDNTDNIHYGYLTPTKVYTSKISDDESVMILDFEKQATLKLRCIVSLRAGAYHAKIIWMPLTGSPGSMDHVLIMDALPTSGTSDTASITSTTSDTDLFTPFFYASDGTTKFGMTELTKGTVFLDAIYQLDSSAAPDDLYNWTGYFNNKLGLKKAIFEDAAGGDALLLGSRTKFSNLRWLKETASVDLLRDWEYYTGSAWSNLTVNSTDAIGDMSTAVDTDYGTNEEVLEFDVPSDWTASDNVTSVLPDLDHPVYWIRFLSDAYTTAPEIRWFAKTGLRYFTWNGTYITSLRRKWTNNVIIFPFCVPAALDGKVMLECLNDFSVRSFPRRRS